MEVGDDLHLIREQFDDISLEERVSDSFEPFGLEFRPEMVEDRVRRWRAFVGATERRDRGPVGARADEDLVDILSIGFSIISEIESNFLIERVDEKVKKLVLVDLTVCLLLLARHIRSKQTF